MEKVSTTESQISSNADILQSISGSEDKFKERPPTVGVWKSFEDLENRAQRTGLFKAASD